VDTKKRRGAVNLSTLTKIDSLAQALSLKNYIGKPLTVTEGLKFAKQAFLKATAPFMQCRVI
jgi:hypothetical protein